jgi:polyisoprenoid-binding protein YceI
MKTKLIALSAAVLLTGLTVNAQTKIFTKKGKITFSSVEPKGEGIAATNNRVASVIEIETGKIEFAVLISAFEFEKATMQEHFNENYMESKQFPKANFKGTITNMSTVDLKKDGTYNVTITGDMTMHGVTKNITEKGVITVKGGKISATADLDLALADYKIKSPKTDQVIKTKVIIANYEPMKK